LQLPFASLQAAHPETARDPLFLRKDIATLVGIAVVGTCTKTTEFETRSEGLKH
jgi:hypothetical protein